jgi:hypothetical protein
VFFVSQVTRQNLGYFLANFKNILGKFLQNLGPFWVFGQMKYDQTGLTPKNVRMKILSVPSEGYLTTIGHCDI